MGGEGGTCCNDGDIVTCKGGKGVKGGKGGEDTAIDTGKSGNGGDGTAIDTGKSGKSGKGGGGKSGEYTVMATLAAKGGGGRVGMRASSRNGTLGAS